MSIIRAEVSSIKPAGLGVAKRLRGEAWVYLIYFFFLHKRKAPLYALKKEMFLKIEKNIHVRKALVCGKLKKTHKVGQKKDGRRSRSDL